MGIFCVFVQSMELLVWKEETFLNPKFKGAS